MRGAMKAARGRGRPAGRRRRPPGYRTQAPGSCTRLFGDECAKILEGLGPKEAAAADRMGALVSRMSRRYPFVFLPDFAEDLMDGMSGSAMRSKYCIESPIDFANLVRYTLKLEGFRSKKHGADNRRRNLEKPGWRKTYELVSSQAEVLRGPLTSLLACRILTAALCGAVLEKGSVPLKDLEARVAASHAKMKKRIHSPPGARLSYRPAQLRALVDHLVAAKRLKKEGGRLCAPPKYSRLQEAMYRILDSRTDGASYQSLMTSTVKEMPLLRFLPKIPGFDSCLDGLLEVGARAADRLAVDQLRVQPAAVHKKELPEAGRPGQEGGAARRPHEVLRPQRRGRAVRLGAPGAGPPRAGLEAGRPGPCELGAALGPGGL